MNNNLVRNILIIYIVIILESSFNKIKMDKIFSGLRIYKKLEKNGNLLLDLFFVKCFFELSIIFFTF